MPLTSVTGKRSKQRQLRLPIEQGQVPNGLAVSETSLANVLVRAMPTVTGTPTCAALCRAVRSAAFWGSCPAVDSKKNSFDRIIFDTRRIIPNDLEHGAAEYFVPTKIAFDVDALRTETDGVPDRHAGANAGAFHLVALGNDAGALIAKHADGFAAQEIIAHSLRRYVEAIGVEMTDGGWRWHARVCPWPVAGRNGLSSFTWTHVQ